MVDDAGGAFFLVHVATPLEECERRDRKGLYAKARRGEIPEFTGISSPYEVPDDADVVVDTTGRTIEAALADVTDALADAGYLVLDDRAPGVEEVETPAAAEPAPAAEIPAADQRPPLEVLFVCTANICRSPFMELTARLAAGEVGAAVRFASAGTHGFVDHAMDDLMGAELAARGGDPTSFRSRPLSRAMVEQADLVLTAEASHRQLILEEQPAALRKVVTLGQAAATVAELDPALDPADVVAEIGRRRGAPDAAYDVDDPYRRGPEAAAVAADRIEALVRTVVAALT